jgi:DNA-binding IclR family transcriptional regulator
MSVRSIKSAERTLALFELFSCQERPLCVGEVAHGLEIPQPSASMLLRNLTQLGYLSYDPLSRRFSPTIRIALLGSWITRRLPAPIVDQMEGLKAIHPQGEVFAAIQNAAAVQCVLLFDDEPAGRFSVTSGRPRTLTCSSAGRALLSLRTDAEVIGWARRCNAEAPDQRLRVNETEFLDTIRQVRAQGYASTVETAGPGRCGIAVALQSPLGGTPIAVGCAGPKAILAPRQDRLIDALQQLRTCFDDAFPTPIPGENRLQPLAAHA